MSLLTYSLKPVFSCVLHSW